MPDTITTYSENIHDIAVNTFEITCYMFPLEDWELEDAGDIERPNGSIRALVEFDGAVEGAMVIAPTENLADAIAQNMLGVDEVQISDREGALCEIANIVCGNTVPIFAKDENICYIRPPRILGTGENPDDMFSHMTKEETTVNLDEGTVDITIYFKAD